jgi:hypothetical protein
MKYFQEENMRQVQNQQMQLGEINIENIQFDPKSRDDIPQILKGLQWIYINIPVREEIFKLLETEIQPEADNNTGRPGMDYWKIFVMGVLRLTLNWDYDALHEHVNQHITIRQMLGHSYLFPYEYHLQTIKDNVRLLTPEILDKINEIVVKAGHTLFKKKEDELLRCRVDSFVLETNVHYPTDTNLLFDAMRKVVTLSDQLCQLYGFSDWRQHAYNLREIKQHLRQTQNKKKPGEAKTEKDKSKQEKKEKERIDAFNEYLEICQVYLSNARETLKKLENLNLDVQVQALKQTIEEFIQHADRQIDQIQRRVLQGETIPHEEKVFSLFEPHTEWVVKGKAGIPVELGVKVCIVEDQHQFILHHKVMEKQTDDQVAIHIVTETKKLFPQLNSCSFDKGFHSPANQTGLKEILNVVALPRKGRLSKEAQAIESSEEYLRAKDKHSAVESAINALEAHGLDVCPDHGIDAFKRYVSLAVVARNIHRIGAILKLNEKKCAERKKNKLIRRRILELTS